mgnify:CR=1 FL=1
MLTDALERVLSPLKIFKIKVHTLAMMMTLALRFIPTLIEEIDRIMNAQKASAAATATSANMFLRLTLSASSALSLHVLTE